MMRYAVRDLYTLLLWIEHTINWTYGQDDAALLNEGSQKTVGRQIGCVKKHCEHLEATETVTACDASIARLSSMSVGECRGYLISIREMLKEICRKRVFMSVPLRASRYAHGYQAPLTDISIVPKKENPLATKPFGERVFITFSEACFDAEQVSLCMVAGASTAAVFHMMRVVEHGVRALGKHLGLRKVRDTLKPIPGGQLTKTKIKVVPIENCTWEKIHNQLRVKIDKRLSKLRPGPVKDEKQIFYSSLLHDFQGFREEWRNHVMHTRAKYNEEQSERVIPNVERFMQAVASTLPLPLPTARRMGRLRTKSPPLRTMGPLPQST